MARKQQTEQSIREGIQWTDTRELVLNQQAMILMPRHFFLYIMEQVDQVAGRENFQKIYRKIGFDGAVTFCRAFEKAHQCTPREAVEGYFEEMSLRGWGVCEILNFDENKGHMNLVLSNSAISKSTVASPKHEVWAAAAEGAFTYFCERTGNPRVVRGTEELPTEQDSLGRIRFSVRPV
jgi:AraC-like DNA-binding protein